MTVLARSETEELMLGGYEDWLDRVRGTSGEKDTVTTEPDDELMPDEAFDFETGWPDVDWGAGVVVPATG